jgi:glutathione S-transferase
MATIQIFGAPQSTFVRVVRMACAEKGVPYDLVPVRPHSPEINAIHPFGKIPGLRHGAVELCESKAIATYIDKSFGGPKLIPDDPVAAAQVEQWVSLINTLYEPVWVRGYLLSYFFPGTPDGSPNRAAIEKALPDMRKQAEILDRAVAGTGYLAGGAFSLADMYLLPILDYVCKLPEAAEIMKANPSLDAYYARHAERPCVQATIPPPPPGR